MSVPKGSGPHVLYVAPTARVLSPEVREWIEHNPGRAFASHNLYDALADLAGGRSPAAIIVELDSVDFSEIEFFDHAARLSRDSSFYVTSRSRQDDKIEAARQRGAKLFDPADIEDDLQVMALRIREETEQAVTARRSGSRPPATAETTEAASDDTAREPETTAESPPSSAPELSPDDRFPSSVGPADRRSVYEEELIEVTRFEDKNRGPEGPDHDAVDEADKLYPDRQIAIEDEEYATEVFAGSDHTFRIRIDDQPSREVDDSNQPNESLEDRFEESSAEGTAVDENPEAEPASSIGFPWSPHPDRPQRTPPNRTSPTAKTDSSEPEESDTNSPGTSDGHDAEEPDDSRPARPPAESRPPRTPINVEITSEELAALLNDPPHTGPRSHEESDR